MRLSAHSLHTYALRYDRPVRWSDIVEDAAPFVMLRLESDTGAVGVGEITVKPTWCGVTARSLVATLEDIFIPIVATLDLSDPAAVRRALDRIPENQAAKTLVDNACWDLHAAASGKPLHGLWGGTRRVHLSWALTRQAPAAMATEAVTMIERHGFRTLKVKGGQGIAVDQAAMREIRGAVGDAVTLYVDANGAYAVADGADYARAMADAGAVIVEDPCALSPDNSFRRLQANVPVPVLVDFGCATLRDTALFIEQGAKAFSIKPGRFGLSDCQTMQSLAVAAGCTPVVGLMGESALGTFAALQFAATIPDPVLPAEVSWFLAMTEQVVADTPRIVGGAIELPASPSLAALVDWDAVRRFGH